MHINSIRNTAFAMVAGILTVSCTEPGAEYPRVVWQKEADTQKPHVEDALRAVRDAIPVNNYDELSCARDAAEILARKTTAEINDMTTSQCFSYSSACGGDYEVWKGRTANQSQCRISPLENGAYGVDFIPAP